MRIAFVNPTVGFSDRRKSKPIGLAYIMAFLKASGYASDGFDFGDSTEDPVHTAQQYGLDRYDIVGFSVYNESFGPAIEMAKWIRAQNPTVLIVMGGPHATAVHEHIVRKHECVDVIVRREGEETMLELVRALEAGQDVTQIPGTTWRAPNGVPKVNCERGYVNDLDALPFPDAQFVSHSGYPALSYFDEIAGALKPAISINSSRSCPYNCSFCGVLTIGRRYRIRTPESVVAEIKYFRETDGVEYKHVYFSDANFFVSVQRCLEIARALHQFDSGMTFSFGTRVNQVLAAQDHVTELKECGLRFVELGVESFSKSMLERMAKEVEPDVNVAAIKMLQRNNVDIALDFIMLDPSSTLDDVAINLHYFKELGLYDYVPHDHLYTALILYEGTPIRHYFEEKLGLSFDPDTLPDYRELFEDPAVSRLSTELNWFRVTWQIRIDDALARLELSLEIAKREHGRFEWDDDTYGRLSLDAISLRHAPNLFLENLLDDALMGYPRTNERDASALLPVLGYDAVPLETLLKRAEDATHALDLGDDPLVLSNTGRFA